MNSYYDIFGVLKGGVPFDSVGIFSAYRNGMRLGNVEQGESRTKPA